MYTEGDLPPSNAAYNRVLRQARRSRLTSVGAGLDLAGGTLARRRVPRIWAKLNGMGPGYGFDEATPSAGGGFTLVAGGRTDAAGKQPAYEINGVPDLAGTYQRLTVSAAGDWRFQERTTGTGGGGGGGGGCVACTDVFTPAAPTIHCTWTYSSQSSVRVYLNPYNFYETCLDNHHLTSISFPLMLAPAPIGSSSRSPYYYRSNPLEIEDHFCGASTIHPGCYTIVSLICGIPPISTFGPNQVVAGYTSFVDPSGTGAVCSAGPGGKDYTTNVNRVACDPFYVELGNNDTEASGGYETMEFTL